MISNLSRNETATIHLQVGRGSRIVVWMWSCIFLLRPSYLFCHFLHQTEALLPLVCPELGLPGPGLGQAPVLPLLLGQHHLGLAQRLLHILLLGPGPLQLRSQSRHFFANQSVIFLKTLEMAFINFCSWQKVVYHTRKQRFLELNRSSTLRAISRMTSSPVIWSCSFLFRAASPAPCAGWSPCSSAAPRPASPHPSSRSPWCSPPGCGS